MLMWLIGSAAAAAAAPTTNPASPPLPPAVQPLVAEAPLLRQLLGDADFFARLGRDEAFDAQMRRDLADAAFRRVGSTRSIRVQLWRATTVERPAIVLEYQTAWKKFMGLPSGGPPQTDPVLIGTGRDSMLHRTFYGGTDDPAAHAAFLGLLEQRAKMPSNRRRDLDPQFTALAEQHLPTRPLGDVRAEIHALILALVEANRDRGATLLDDPQYGHFGAKLADHLYVYLRDFPEDAPTRFEHDGFFWLILSGGPMPVPTGIPAFPGAEGMGALATGGRGGRVIYVTNTDSEGPGSLKEALLTPGPRTVLFAVSGQIVLPDETWITEPNLTLIGYTAPGEGVEITGRLCMAADNVIFRGVRFRLRPPRAMDGMNTRGNLRNVIFDHCSFAYASDELLRFIGNGSTFLGFTIQYCLLGPGMAGLGSHPYGPEVGGYGTFHHNLFYNALSRSPEVDCDLIDWRHNIMANLRSGHSLRPQSRFNFVDNYVIDMSGNPNAYSFNANDSVWESGNLREFEGKVAPFSVQREGSSAFLKHAHPAVPVTATDPRRLEALLVPIAGAHLPTRDATDRYFLQRFQARDSRLPYWEKPGTTWSPYGNENNNMDLYRKWDESLFPPPAAGATAPADTDRDGMPDAWEAEHMLNPTNPDDGQTDLDRDGYTNLEEYLYRTNPREFIDYTKPENNRHTLH
jgi:hypothetical protein